MNELNEADARAIQERYERNIHKAAQVKWALKAQLADGLKGVRRMALAELRPVYDGFRKFECIICGASMKAKRSSKTTCSARCRTRLTQFRRAGRERELGRKLQERGLLLSQMPDHCGRNAPLNWVVFEDKRKIGKRGKRIGKIGPVGRIVATSRKLETLELWAEKELRAAP